MIFCDKLDTSKCNMLIAKTQNIKKCYLVPFSTNGTICSCRMALTPLSSVPLAFLDPKKAHLCPAWPRYYITVFQSDSSDSKFEFRLLTECDHLS